MDSDLIFGGLNEDFISEEEKVPDNYEDDFIFERSDNLSDDLENEISPDIMLEMERKVYESERNDIKTETLMYKPSKIRYSNIE